MKSDIKMIIIIEQNINSGPLSTVSSDDNGIGEMIKKSTLLTTTVITSNREFDNCYSTARGVVIYFSTKV